MHKQKIQVIELFAGSRSIGKAAEALGMDVWSTDLKPFDGIDRAQDLLSIPINEIPKNDNSTILWASPPCTGFTIAAVSSNWQRTRQGLQPRRETARLGVALVERTLEIIEVLKPDVWFIENPRGMLRKMPFMRGLPRTTVTYCQYGDRRMKPTDIWTNCWTWQPRPMCKNGDPCHDPAPRGSHEGGTQGLAGNYERSMIPHELCVEALSAARHYIMLPPEKKTCLSSLL